MLIDEQAQTTGSALFAVGETAAGPHGADRLGGGMVSGGQVFGLRAGRHAAEHARAADARTAGRHTVASALSRLGAYGKGAVPAEALIGELQAATTRLMRVVREKTLLTRIEQLRGEKLALLYAGDAAALKRAIEASNLITSAELMARAELIRRESRGSHFRRDYPQMDDAHWRSSTVLKLQESSIREQMRSLESPQRG
jgi:fumarate reductase (CoM/CoB) subunit A